MEAEPKLNEKYENGVWYDSAGGEFCQIRDLGDTIGLFRPDCSVEENDPYYTFDENREQNPTKADSIEQIRGEMRTVPNAAVRNPVEYIYEILDTVVGIPGSNRRLTAADERGIMYARGQVKISEA